MTTDMLNDVSEFMITYLITEFTKFKPATFEFLFQCSNPTGLLKGNVIYNR